MESFGFSSFHVPQFFLLCAFILQCLPPLRHPYILHHPYPPIQLTLLHEIPQFPRLFLPYPFMCISPPHSSIFLILPFFILYPFIHQCLPLPLPTSLLHPHPYVFPHPHLSIFLHQLLLKSVESQSFPISSFYIPSSLPHPSIFILYLHFNLLHNEICILSSFSVFTSSSV